MARTKSLMEWTFIQADLNYLSGTTAPGSFTSPPPTRARSLGDLMLGEASRFGQGQLVGWYPRQHYFGGYFQDTWKATSHLYSDRRLAMGALFVSLHEVSSIGGFQ